MSGYDPEQGTVYCRYRLILEKRGVRFNSLNLELRFSVIFKKLIKIQSEVFDLTCTRQRNINCALN